MDKFVPPYINAHDDSLSSHLGIAFGRYAKLSFEIKEFIAAQEKFHEEMDRALYVFGHQTLIAAFGTWARKMQILEPKIVDRSEELFRIWKLLDNKYNIFVTLLEVPTLNHEIIINGIRSLRNRAPKARKFLISSYVSFEERENLVSTYISFINWLSEITLNYIKPLVDPDYQKRQGRVIDYKIFILLLECLDEKSQLVAKLLYFGGSRTLEEVLDLEISDIDFDRNLINFRSQLIHYPLHILEDIRVLIGNRKSGRVFLGRQDAPLNPSTIFRSFKEAGSQVGLGNSFSAKMLTINK